MTGEEEAAVHEESPKPSPLARQRQRDRPVDAVPWSLQVSAEWSARFLLVVAGVYVAWRMLDAVSLVTIALVVALLVTALLQPGAALFVRAGMRRSLAVASVFVVGLLAIGATTWFVVDQISSNATRLSTRIGDAQVTIRDWLVHGPLHLSQHQLDQIAADITTAISTNRNRIASGLFSTAGTVAELTGGLLLCVFAIFFLLRDGDTVWGWVVRLFPSQARRAVDGAGRHAWHTLSGYVNGVIIVALADAVTVTIVLLVIRVPAATALGVLIFLGAFVPLIGLIVTGGLAVLVTLVAQGFGAALVVLIAIVVAVQAEGHLLHPMVMSRAVRVHPLAVVLSVTAGTLLAGIFGALIAVPLAAVVNTVTHYLISEHGDAAADGAGDGVSAGAAEDAAGAPSGTA